MQGKKLLLINYMETTASGGINKTVLEIAKNLSKRGYDVTVLQGNPLNLPSEEFYQGFKIVRIKSSIGNYLYGLSPEMYLYLKRNFKSINPDIVHVHGYHTLLSLEVIYIIKSIDSKIPIVFSPYFDISRSSFAGRYLWRIYNYFGKKAFLKSSHLIFCSNSEAKNAFENFKTNASFSIIPLGVDTLNNQNRFNNVIERKTCRILYSGYLIRRKGVNLVLESLKRLIYELGVKNVSLTIIGEGSEKKRLLKLSKNLQLEDYIIWKPFLPREEFINEMKSADVFVLLSHSEAFGIVIAEALAMGIPCIVTKRTALEEFTTVPGCFGVSYPPDPREVADLILRIYSSKVKVGPFGDKIRTWENVSEDYEKVYMSLLKEDI